MSQNKVESETITNNEAELLPKLQGRSAGILMHITSLPSAFGIGDLGPEAKKFAGFLHRSNQQYWQILPLNPTGEDQGYSPYSATSALAGNTLLISPEVLVQNGLLQQGDIQKNKTFAKRKVNFKKAGQIREPLFSKAYDTFVELNDADKLQQFASFCDKENYWLHDFALYEVLKKQIGLPWYEWPSSLRKRDQKALADVAEKHADEISKIKWLQFIFSQQWQDLKYFCNSLNIRMFGDLPFYVSYDSADVWAHPDIFNLDAEGKIKGIAGVPPDYFNANGQLWGMPVFKWDVLEKQNYDWWIKRIGKNLELFDLLRLDHFRAFAAYWDVPAGETTAINGKWKTGPGKKIFETLLEVYGELPFVAEDLGDINDEVIALRKEFEMPGMKVLQFAFGDNMPQSDYIPHTYESNFFVYTGTHDNNTTVGWFRKDSGKQERKNLKRYLNKKVNKKNVHKEMIRLAYASVATAAIIPIQDILGLKEDARFNTPASTNKNWLWCLSPSMLNERTEKRLRKLVKLFNR